MANLKDTSFAEFEPLRTSNHKTKSPSEQSQFHPHHLSGERNGPLSVGSALRSTVLPEPEADLQNAPSEPVRRLQRNKERLHAQDTDEFSWISVPASCVRLTQKGIDAAILSRIHYWTSRGQDNTPRARPLDAFDFDFANRPWAPSYLEIADQIGISIEKSDEARKKQIQRAIRRLEENGLIIVHRPSLQEHREGDPGQRHLLRRHRLRLSGSAKQKLAVPGIKIKVFLSDIERLGIDAAILLGQLYRRLVSMRNKLRVHDRLGRRVWAASYSQLQFETGLPINRARQAVDTLMQPLGRKDLAIIATETAMFRGKPHNHYRFAATASRYFQKEDPRRTAVVDLLVNLQKE